MPGGSERLAIATIECLNEMGFVVDVQTCIPLEIKNLDYYFGHSDISIRHRKHLDMLSFLLNFNSEALTNDDFQYDLIINTHGDMLPYFHKTVERDNNNKKTTIFTYCHYPLLPYEVIEGKYRESLQQFIKIDNLMSSNNDIVNSLYSNAYSLYDLMMINTVVFTNSKFSKRAIKQLYGNKVKAEILRPPVDVEAFRKAALHSKEREDIIIIVSRFSSDKQIHNAIRLAKILSDKKVGNKMIIVGSISNKEPDYHKVVSNMVNEYDLQSYITLEVNSSFEKLLHLMSKSKVYFHCMEGEPFGISVAEGMAAGLIPVVPPVGGNTEFVPQKYHYKTIEHAAEIIENVLFNSSQKVRVKLSNSVCRLSKENYKKNLRNKIKSLNI